MRLRLIALLAVVAAVPALAQGYNFKPDEYQYLSAGALDKTLVMHPGEHPYAGNVVDRHETYWIEFMKRFDHGNLIENHEHWVDYITVLSGEGDVTYGGIVAGASPAGTGELRGGTMSGGTTQALGAGDYLQIPAGVPHIINAAPGKELSYVIFKHRI
jgi:mannose-6-phosphate isomerase-like protein (cupin superfamily)